MGDPSFPLNGNILEKFEKKIFYGIFHTGFRCDFQTLAQNKIRTKEKRIAAGPRRPTGGFLATWRIRIAVLNQKSLITLL